MDADLVDELQRQFNPTVSDDESEQEIDGPGVDPLEDFVQKIRHKEIKAGKVVCHVDPAVKSATLDVAAEVPEDHFEESSGVQQTGNFAIGET